MRSLQDHMRFDIKSGPCSIIVLQEAKHDLLMHLREPGQDGVPEDSGATRGSGVNWQRRPTSQYIGIRGAEQGSSLVIAARTSIVKGVRLLLFRKREDGTFRAKKTRGGEGKKKAACSRILIVACQMRFSRITLHGSGEEEIRENELVVVNVHLHYMTAKKEVSDGANSLAK